MKCGYSLSALVLMVTLGAFSSALAQSSQPTEVSTHHVLVFRYSAPEARSVTIRGSWSPQLISLHEDNAGIWTAIAPELAAGSYPYRVLIDGEESKKPDADFQVLHVPPQDSPQFPDAAPHGAVHGRRYFSKTMEMDRELWVYTPPGLEDGRKRYPLLVLQHAGADTQKTWVSKGNVDWLLDQLIAAGRAHPMVVLMLDGHPQGESAYMKADTRLKAMNDLKRELLEEAIPLVESKYPIDPARESHALAGPSVGGGQVISIGLCSLDRFAWIGVFSQGHAIPELYQSALYDPTRVNTQLKLFWLSCAKGDSEFKNNQTLIKTLDANGIHYEWYATEGAHSWTVWRRDLTEYLCRIFKPSGGEHAK